MKKSEKVIREAVAEMFEMLAYKVRNGVMCEEDIEALRSFIHAGVGVKATAKEIASFYGQSIDNVRHVIARNPLPAPCRRVYYDFGAFARHIPEKWHAHHSLPAD